MRVVLPDPVLALPEVERAGRAWGGDPLLQVDGVGAFVRCLLPVHLTGGTLLTFGTWLSIHPDDLRRAHAVWDTDGYAGLELDGVLANAIKPWGEAIFAAPARVAVRNVEHVPYVVGSADPVVGAVLADVWDRDEVLGRLAHALPVAIRARVSDEWSVERGAGFTVGVHGGSLRFVAPGRTVILDALGTDPERTVDEMLALMLDGAPETGGRRTEREGGELRHAYWLTAGAQHELYGLVVRPGAMLQITCIHDDPADHAWAVHTWRSVRYHGAGPD